MKNFFKRVVLFSVAFYILPAVITGVTIKGGFPSYILIGFVFSLMDGLIKPVLKILTFPLTLITFGLFAFFLNAILLYVLTLFVPFITITAFTFEGATFAGFVVPKIEFNIFLTYVVASLVISSVVSLISWVFDK